MQEFLVFPRLRFPFAQAFTFDELKAISYTNPQTWVPDS